MSFRFNHQEFLTLYRHSVNFAAEALFEKLNKANERNKAIELTLIIFFIFSSLFFITK